MSKVTSKRVTNECRYEQHITRVALAVIEGRYGNGRQRIRLMSRLGLEYGAVQREVNRLMRLKGSGRKQCWWCGK